MAAVVALAFEALGQACKNNGRVRSPRRFHRRGKLRFVRLVPVRRESLGVYNVRAVHTCRIQRAGHGAGIDVRRAAALIPGLFREAANIRNLRGPCKRQRALVLQQHRAFFFQLCRQRMVCRAVKLRLRMLYIRIAEHDVQNACHRLVQHRFLQRTAAHCRNDLRVPHAVGRWHFQLQPCGQALYAVVHRSPVAHHISVKPPLIPQDLFERVRIFTGKHPVELVVAAHQRPGPRLFHDRLKRRKVNFPQRPLAHVGRARHAPVFLVVGSIMLHARAHIPALHTAHLRRRQLSRQIRVLAEILKVPPAQRAALDVHRRPQKHRHILRAALLAQRPPHPFQQRLIEAGRRRACRREAHRLDAVVDAQMVRLLVLLAQPVRAVRHHHARDAQPFHALQMPEIRARTQPGLFLQRHLRHKLVYIAFQKNTSSHFSVRPQPGRTALLYSA